MDRDTKLRETLESKDRELRELKQRADLLETRLTSVLKAVSEAPPWTWTDEAATDAAAAAAGPVHLNPALYSPRRNEGVDGVTEGIQVLPGAASSSKWD